MKRANSNSAVSKLGESVYNTLVLTNQVNGGEKRILHYSYNLTTEAGQEDTYGDLEKNYPLYRSERMIHAHSQEEKHVSDKKRIQRSSSIPLPGRRIPNNKSEKPLERSNATEPMFYGGAMQGNAETSTTQDVSEATIAENSETLNNGSRESHSRKFGVGETTNTSIMSHKLRKKAVCDTTDNSHYQRQFLRVLNKRFWTRNAEGSLISTA